MADVINLVPSITKVPASGGYKTPLSQAVDVSAYDKLDLQLNVISGTFTKVEVFSSMQNDSDEGWANVGTFSGPSAGYTQVSFPTSTYVLLRYVRVEATASADGLITLRGMARRNG